MILPPPEFIPASISLVEWLLAFLMVSVGVCGLVFFILGIGYALAADDEATESTAAGNVVWSGRPHRADTNERFWKGKTE